MATTPGRPRPTALSQPPSVCPKSLENHAEPVTQPWHPSLALKCPAVISKEGTLPTSCHKGDSPGERKEVSQVTQRTRSPRQPWRSPSLLRRRSRELLPDILRKLRLTASPGSRASREWGRDSNLGLHAPSLRTVKPHAPGSSASALLGFDSECLWGSGADKRGQKEREFLSPLKDVTLTSSFLVSGEI